ncbi:hypothetical protein MC5_06110 [Rickettsia australis str. Cutlack]|uniref:YhcG N-terminal domain-containing protein n=1 Tax=Rickettsia australis (strain Cutlack) TaxID=1105110 RepID=H8K877_RICAC|nr:hypothetical protein [Rickettsia australis]AFC71470.1 hypothetical protein MC5_06110 [Rickettsia australis str. Cutlack]
MVLYWNIGKLILEHQNKEKWVAKVIQNISCYSFKTKKYFGMHNKPLKMVGQGMYYLCKLNNAQL